ncbi:MAG: hypothetical protein SV583_10570 [Pseudomonadota bacterium]|nr:hypothetical protein [Pseudomonadota bacterium]
MARRFVLTVIGPTAMFAARLTQPNGISGLKRGDIHPLPRKVLLDP